MNIDLEHKIRLISLQIPMEANETHILKSYFTYSSEKGVCNDKFFKNATTTGIPSSKIQNSPLGLSFHPIIKASTHTLKILTYVSHF
jgi:hypothetical protein